MPELIDELIKTAVETNQWVNFDSERWMSFLSLNVPNFKGDYKNAANLLSMFCTEIKSVSQKYLNYKYPTKLDSMPIALLYSPEENHAFYYNRPNNKKICFELAALETLSLMDQQKVYELNDLEDDVETWTGTIPELVRQMGIEESHHAVYASKKVIKRSSRLLSQPEYDSKQHEFRALLWQIRDLKSRDVNNSAEVLERRIAKAKIVLEKNSYKE